MLAVVAMTVATTLAACSSTTSSAPVAASGSAIPAAAFRDHTGVTPTTVRIGNISTSTIGLFTGASVGTQAYAAYVNSTGGVNGRKIVVDSTPDTYNDGAQNKALTQQDIGRDFAMVGSFSLNDSYGGTVLAANPSVPNVSVSLDQATNRLPNTFSPQPAVGGWELGPLVYFQKKYPADVLHAGALIAGEPSAETDWQGEKAAMEHLGYKVVYSPTFQITQANFTQNVIDMRDAGVKILFIEQMPESYASAVFQALDAQNFHPVVVLGASTYSNALVTASGGPSVVDGAYLEQALSLYLGGDASSIPAVSRFLSWVQKVSPGFKPDLYTLYGWASAELFVQALRRAGSNPSRGSELQALRSIHTFSASDLIAPADPAAKKPGNCYIIAHLVNGQFVRTGDPPVTSSTGGYRCDQPYFYPPGSKD